MIKVNLLESATDKAKGVVAVESRVASPHSRSMILMVAVGALLALTLGFDWFSAGWSHRNAQVDLQREEEIAARMAQVNKEQAELEKKITDIQARIDAIKKLRASQQGPVAVLSAINDRLPSIADFRLETIEQKGGDLIVQGHSPNEAAVTQFGRSLEFSSGLFTNVSIETERKALEVSSADFKPGDAPIDPDAPKPETVKFKIKCNYAAPGTTADQAGGAMAAPATRSTQVAQK